MLSGKGLCDGPMPRPDESYRLCCVIVCALETPRTRRPLPPLVSCTRVKKGHYIFCHKPVLCLFYLVTKKMSLRNLRAGCVCVRACLRA